MASDNASADINVLGLQGKEYVETFDLSASRRSKCLFFPPIVGRFSVEVDWTSTGTPVGVFTFETTNNPAATSGKTMDASTNTAFVAMQPGHTSDVGSFFKDNVAMAGKRVWIVYTRTSGGTGATAAIRISVKERY